MNANVNIPLITIIKIALLINVFQAIIWSKIIQIAIQNVMKNHIKMYCISVKAFVVLILKLALRPA